MTDHEPNAHPLRLVGTTYRSFGRLVDVQLRELGFAMSQLPVLVTLKQRKSLAQAELARIAQVEQSSMAQLLNRMERDGLIRRDPDPDDGRSRLVSLTETASRRMHKARAIMDATSEKALVGFDDHDLEQLRSLLSRINTNLDKAASLASR